MRRELADTAVQAIAVTDGKTPIMPLQHRFARRDVEGVSLRDIARLPIGSWP